MVLLLWCRLTQVVLEKRPLNECSVVECRWKGSGCKFSGTKGKRYKLFWKGGEERLDGVGVFITEKWVECC